MVDEEVINLENLVKMDLEYAKVLKDAATKDGYQMSEMLFWIPERMVTMSPLKSPKYDTLLGVPAVVKGETVKLLTVYYPDHHKDFERRTNEIVDALKSHPWKSSISLAEMVERQAEKE